MRISDWSSDVCSSDLNPPPAPPLQGGETLGRFAIRRAGQGARGIEESHIDEVRHRLVRGLGVARGDRLEHAAVIGDGSAAERHVRTEERRVGKEGVRTLRYRGWVSN